MKTWKPASAPSVRLGVLCTCHAPLWHKVFLNTVAHFIKPLAPCLLSFVLQNRDRLELYALHKQAVSGDAPSTFSSQANAADRAKYQAWRTKVGLSGAEAMRLYLSEADRQIRVYGNLTPQTPQATPNTTSTNGGNSTNNGGTSMMDTPRGLAAIPLLCAAAAESRQAYIRRLAQTPYENAWWKRQEALCGTPGTFTALPELSVLQLARFVEHVSLATAADNAALQAFLWPLHNCLLSLWMLMILVLTLGESSGNILQIVVWGARRTGLSLGKVWDHDLALWQQCVVGMCESHQAMTCRLVALLVLPASYTYGAIKRLIGSRSMTLASAMFVVLLGTGWWYFVFVLPWLAICMLGMACASGSCFALIQVAGV